MKREYSDGSPASQQATATMKVCFGIFTFTFVTNIIASAGLDNRKNASKATQSSHTIRKSRG